MEVLAIAAVAGASALAGWLADRRNTRTRNANSQCAGCGDDQRGADSTELYLIHGRLVCADCAETAKKRTVWQFVGLAGAVAFATTMIALEKGMVGLLGVPLGTGLLMTAGTVHLMKLANRRAQARIAAGQGPAFTALVGDNGAGVADGPQQSNRLLPEP